MNMTKRHIASAILALVLASTTTLANENYKEIQRDVEVMSRALQAAAGDDNRAKSSLRQIGRAHV